VDNLEEDYREPDTTSSGEGDKSGALRPHDRVQIAGWVGLFIASIPILAGIVHLGSPDGWQRSHASRVLGITGSLTAFYLFAGGFLVVRGLQSRPIQGDAVRFLNLAVVAPLFILLAVPLFALILVPLFSLSLFGRLELATIASALLTTANSCVLWVVIIRHRRVVLQSVRRWLDPTIDSFLPPAERP
jgi:hypothetical protein